MALLCQEGCSKGTDGWCAGHSSSVEPAFCAEWNIVPDTACACQTCMRQTRVTRTSRRMCCGPWPARPVRAAKGRIPGADAQRAAAAPAEWASCAHGMQPRLRRRPMAAALPAAASRGPPRGWAAALTEPGSCSCQSTQSIQSHFDLPCSYDVR
jgi:hypothetical protein